MKWLLATATLFLTIHAHAGDRKLGNVIAVEREITNIYQTCVDQYNPNDPNNPTEPNTIYGCKIPVVKGDTEFAVATKRLITLSDKACSVEGDLQNGSIIFYYYGLNKTDFETAKSCLRTSLGATDSFKAVVYTIQ